MALFRPVHCKSSVTSAAVSWLYKFGQYGFYTSDISLVELDCFCVSERVHPRGLSNFVNYCLASIGADKHLHREQTKIKFRLLLEILQFALFRRKMQLDPKIFTPHVNILDTSSHRGLKKALPQRPRSAANVFTGLDIPLSFQHLNFSEFWKKKTWIFVCSKSLNVGLQEKKGLPICTIYKRHLIQLQSPGPSFLGFVALLVTPSGERPAFPAPHCMHTHFHPVWDVWHVLIHNKTPLRLSHCMDSSGLGPLYSAFRQQLNSPCSRLITLGYFCSSYHPRQLKRCSKAALCVVNLLHACSSKTCLRLVSGMEY